MATVAELVEYLQKLPQEADIILSSDAEGNKYSPWSGDHSLGLYIPDNDWSGEVIDESDDGVEWNAVILWPVN